VDPGNERVGDSPGVERSLARSFLDDPAHLKKGHETAFGVVSPVRVFLIEGDTSLVGGLNKLFCIVLGVIVSMRGNGIGILLSSRLTDDESALAE